jgi:hypothetical protein
VVSSGLVALREQAACDVLYQTIIGTLFADDTAINRISASLKKKWAFPARWQYRLARKQQLELCQCSDPRVIFLLLPSVVF